VFSSHGFGGTFLTAALHFNAPTDAFVAVILQGLYDCTIAIL